MGTRWVEDLGSVPSKRGRAAPAMPTVSFSCPSKGHHPSPGETLQSKGPKPCLRPTQTYKCTGVSVPPGAADPLSPTAAQEAGLRGEGGEAAAGADAAAGSLREEGADGAAAAHAPGAGAGLAADAAGEDGAVCARPQLLNKALLLKALQPCQAPPYFWVQVVGLST